MVKNSIKIYARLKQESSAKTATVKVYSSFIVLSFVFSLIAITNKYFQYEVLRTEQHETITFRVSSGSGNLTNKPQTHKFRKVF